MLDLAHVFDLALGALATIVGFLAKMFHARLSTAEEKLTKLHEIYVKRDDFKDTLERVFTLLERIDDKLDSKVDKIHG